MIQFAVGLLVIALVLGVLGFGGLVGVAVGLLKILFFIVLALAVLLFVLGFTVYRKVT